jgi:ABC-type bacteriocin/lantibiotic exporter with double-glycine peptidase domain
MNIVTILCATISYLMLPIRFITVGIAVSFGIGYLSSSLLARFLLSKRIGRLNIRKELLSILLISFIAFAPGLLISSQSESLLNSGAPNAFTSLLTLVVTGAIALPIFLGIGYVLKVSSILAVAASVKRKLAKR